MEASRESKCQQVYWGREQVIKSIIIIFLPDFGICALVTKWVVGVWDLVGVAWSGTCSSLLFSSESSQQRSGSLEEDGHEARRNLKL